MPPEVMAAMVATASAARLVRQAPAERQAPSASAMEVQAVMVAMRRAAPLAR
jgi:hypothetical protein